MSIIGTPSSAGPSTPITRLHIHPSVPSHLSTELSFLQTLLLRARDQHRTQLFLRRMYEVLKMGKLILKYVKDTSIVDEQGWEKRRLRGEQLVCRTIKSLFTAQRFTSQIIELHHFLPLQTSTLAIYARLCTITMNIAQGLGMDLEQLISLGGQIHSRKKRSVLVDMQDRAVELGPGVMVIDGSENDMNIHGVELGEKIERQSSIFNSSVHQSTTQPDIPKPSNHKQPQSPLSLIGSSRPVSASSAVRSRSPVIPSTSEHQEITSAPVNPGNASAPVPPWTDVEQIPSKGLAQEEKPRKKKKSPFDIDSIFDSVPPLSAKHKDHDLGSSKISSESKKQKAPSRPDADMDKSTKKVSKKKKKDAMDDIFGF
ncbi:hypothetical protein I302_104138 [Kwoniella bestiolae CBS 10118]|uniref:Nucleolus and neural progenitor protein-like N-terminal domain-containing protein n=1 Tax=Kwoniella bestiolae CBS 10118 TaxID=1296100 RepID=A0A1B9GAE8_9TREE|nr:hypothetical protein I302_02846 [Kwoniella bestiolae CBS 10118]OCF27996.1 hypothetical protein I302_02846 [Kwoniella bestiolae CBS 10118]